MQEDQRVYLQFQTRTGSWTTYNECENDPIVIKRSLDVMETNIGANYKCRVRAIDKETGSLLDLRVFGG